MNNVNYWLKYIDENNLFVTGGSAGGIMTAWIIGKSDRFKAAVVAKPVMNWISKTLTADNYYGYANSRYKDQPWENFEEYWKFSPISLVGNIKTPKLHSLLLYIIFMFILAIPILAHHIWLNIVKNIVELHGGSIVASNQPSEAKSGAKIQVLLPIYK